MINDDITKLNSSVKSEKILGWVSYFVIIDLLFMPYFPLFVIPYSLPIVMISLVYLNDNFQKKEFIIFILLSTGILISTFISLFLNIESTYIIENIKRSLQFLTTFSYYFFFRTVLRKVELNLTIIFSTFIIYLLTLMSLFLTDPLSYLNIRTVLYPVGSASAGEFLFFKRFDYMFADPNTAGYFILLVIFYVLIKCNLSFILRLIFIITIFAVIVSTKSTGATLASVVFFIYYFYNFIKKILTKRNRIKGIFFSIMLLVLVYFIFDYVSDPSSTLSLSIEEYVERLQNSTENNESRLVKYSSLTKEFYPLLFGTGYSLVKYNEIIKPHNDHLRLIYSYGIFSYVLLIAFFFHRIKFASIVILLPAFIAFSVNTLIDEQKFLAIFLVLLALLRNDYD